jgi:hypothetical protein
VGRHLSSRATGPLLDKSDEGGPRLPRLARSSRSAPQSSPSVQCRTAKSEGLCSTSPPYPRRLGAPGFHLRLPLAPCCNAISSASPFAQTVSCGSNVSRAALTSSTERIHGAARLNPRERLAATVSSCAAGINGLEVPVFPPLGRSTWACFPPRQIVDEARSIG